MKLFVFPYAYGTDAIYSDFSQKISKEIQLIRMNYPGHGRRFNQTLMNSIESLAEDSIEQMDIEQNYSILGYSMGAMVCCEIMKQLSRDGKHLPCHVFLLGSKPPNVPSELMNSSNLNIEKSKQLLIDMGQTAEELVDNQELMELFFPIIKSDSIAVENYFDSIPCDDYNGIQISIINGNQEKNHEMEWLKYFNNNDIDLIKYEGGHFFLFENEDTLGKFCKYVNDLFASQYYNKNGEVGNIL